MGLLGVAVPVCSPHFLLLVSNNYLIMSPIEERTFIMVKPDGVQRGLVGEIIKRFEQRGFKLVAMKFCKPPQAHFEKHYEDLAGKSFFPGSHEVHHLRASCSNGMGRAWCCEDRKSHPWNNKSSRFCTRNHPWRLLCSSRKEHLSWF